MARSKIKLLNWNVDNCPRKLLLILQNSIAQTTAISRPRKCIIRHAWEDAREQLPADSIAFHRNRYSIASSRLHKCEVKILKKIDFDMDRRNHAAVCDRFRLRASNAHKLTSRRSHLRCVWKLWGLTFDTFKPTSVRLFDGWILTTV